MAIPFGAAPRSCRAVVRWTLAIYFIAALTSVGGITGCGGSGGAAGKPSLNASSAAAKAIELYDKNGSGSLDESELADCPGLLAVRDRYDSNSDRQISQDEIKSRLEAIVATNAPWLTVTCHVSQAGRPLAGAKVSFKPEAFLGESLLPASGTTDAQGVAFPAVAVEMRPDKFKGSNIVQPGVYRVEIEHPSIKEKHKPLGCEIDELARGGTEVRFNL